jgi:hypothetical protein
MLHYLDKIIRVGVDESYDTQLKKRIVLINKDAFIAVLFTIVSAVVLYYLFPDNYYWILLFIVGVIVSLTFYFNYIKYI